MNYFSRLAGLLFAAVLFLGAGCATEKLPSEDIEIFTKHKDIIDVLKSDRFSADSKEKYEAAKQLAKVWQFVLVPKSYPVLEEFYIF